jgi:hypothetical protein
MKFSLSFSDLAMTETAFDFVENDENFSINKLALKLFYFILFYKKKIECR